MNPTSAKAERFDTPWQNNFLVVQILFHFQVPKFVTELLVEQRLIEALSSQIFFNFFFWQHQRDKERTLS